LSSGITQSDTGAYGNILDNPSKNTPNSRIVLPHLLLIIILHSIRSTCRACKLLSSFDVEVQMWIGGKNCSEIFG